MTRTRTLLVPLLVACGCSSAPGVMEAPDTAVWGGPLAEARVAAWGEAALGADAEEDFARARRPVEPPTPPRQLDPGGEPSPAELERLLAGRPRLAVPCRLAVVEARRPCERVVVPAWGRPRLEAAGQAWSLRPPLPAALGALRAGLDPLRAAEAGQEWPKLEAPRRDPFAAIDPLPGLLLPEQASLGAARRAAARIGADVVLVYACAARVYAWRNGCANLYPTLVGLLLPGEERAALVRAEAALVDVRTGAVLAVAQTEARGETRHAPLLGGGPEEEPALVEAASQAAVAGLAIELRRALAGLEAAGRFAPPPAEQGTK